MIATAPSAPRPQVDPSAGSAPPEATSQRDPRGRFAQGNKGGPGNPFARRTAQFRKVLLEVVTDEDIQAAARKLIEQARAGDLAAIRILFSYAIGKPTAAVDPDRVDVDEWQLLQQSSVTPQAMNGVLQSLPADWVVHLLQIAWPCVVQTMGQQVGAGIDKLNRKEAARAAREQARPQTEAGNGSAAVEPMGPSRNGSNGAEAGADRPSRNGSNGATIENSAGSPGERKARQPNQAAKGEALNLSPEMAQLLMDLLEDLPIGNGPNGRDGRAAPHPGGMS
jgi:hypothetical protein